MTLTPIPLQPLERGYLKVLRTRSAVSWAILAVIALFGGALLQWRAGGWAMLMAVPVAAYGAFSTIILARARWRRWGYAFTGSELHVSRGWLFQMHTIVPVSRVQHIDISQGPLERGAGVATLSLHTAGSENSLVVLPGLSRERAEALRDTIRGRIGDTPW
jgi:uncharacterized protein